VTGTPLVAMIDSRDCVWLALGMEVELFAPSGEAVLVPLV
jgi:hypothetical protein